MKTTGKTTMAYILPFAVWMGLMFALPPTALSYAVRSAATLIIGVVCLAFCRQDAAQPFANARNHACAYAAGIVAGVVVCALWIWLPTWPFPEPPIPDPSPYAPTTCGWTLTLAKLAGSAFVIAPVEEVFFRSFLYRWLIDRNFAAVPLARFDLSAFLWTVLIFSLEHDRPIAAAITGAIYGLLAIRMGIGSAIAAHVTTNLLLGLHVIHHNAWQFW